MKDIKNILLNQVEAINKAYMNYNNNPYEPETAHALRVSTRELRGLLNFLKNKIGEEPYQQMNGLLREAAQVYGPVREIDVLIEHCSELALAYPELSTDYRQLFAKLRSDRDHEMVKTFDKKNTDLMANAIETVRNTTGALEWQSDANEQINWNKYLGARFKQRSRQLKKAYNEIDLEDYETVHETRKQAKKVRYATKYFGSLTNKNVKKIGKQAEKIQNEFGAYTDAHINKALLRQYSQKVKNPDLQSLFLTLSEL